MALASPAASIVDEEVYDADRVRDPKDSVVGSGPFAVDELASDELLLARYEDYVGRTPARLAELVYRTVADSATIEDAMTKGTVEVVWRGLDAAAITRLQQQVQQSPEEQTESGYPPTVLTGARVLQLQWSPESRARSSKALRTGDRPGPAGRPDLRLPGPGRRRRATQPTFPLGGKATPKVTWKSRINLTLGYDPTTPDGRDLAVQIRTRLEDTGGLSVKLRPASPAPTCSCWTARRGRPRPWPGSSPTWTRRCPTSPRPWTRWRPSTAARTDDGRGRPAAGGPAAAERGWTW